MVHMIVCGAIAVVAFGVGYGVRAWLHRDPGWLCTRCGRNPVDQVSAVCDPCFVDGGPR